MNDYFVFDAKTMDILSEVYNNEAFACSSVSKSVMVALGKVMPLVHNINKKIL